MYQFQSEPPVDPRGNSLLLHRTPTARPMKGIITCHDLVGTRTHFYHGRTIPCDSEHCPAHADGVPWRWHAYVSVFNPRTHEHILFECTARPADVLKTYRLAYGSLRGCLLTARRAHTAANSRVILTTTRADLAAIQLPDPPNILAALAIIWNIELPAIEIAGMQKGYPTAQVIHDPALDRCDQPPPTADVGGGNGRGRPATD